VVTTASDPEGRRTVVDLVGGDIRVVPVGRLDFETTGVLLLMNEGPLAHRLAHPSFEVEKTYVVDVEGTPSASTLRALARGVSLDDGRTAPATVERLGPARLQIVLHEGRNRQVRRMCEAVGHPATRLHRSGYAGLELRNLKPGAWRNLTRDEVERLRVLTGIA
jgi:pseudouridine synthase